MITEIGYSLPDCSRIRFQNSPTLKFFENFNSLDSYFTEYESQRASQSVRNNIDNSISRWQTDLQSASESSWYGLKSRMRQVDWRFLYNRTDFVYRDIYDDLKRKTWDRIQRLLRNQSIADIIKKNFEWNDKELGIFSFDKASLGLLPKYAFFSPKYNTTFQADLVETIGDDKDSRYILKSDKSEIILSYEVNLNEPNQKGESIIYLDAKNEIDIDEINKIGFLSVISDINNSFIHQVPKPKIANAVRIFIDFGCNAGVQWNQKIYCGMFGVILSELFEYLGYSTSIVPYIGFQRNSEALRGTAYRLLAYQAKKFSDTLETEKLLLSCSDIAFFRTRFFLYAHLLSDSYGDNFYSGIGSNMSREEKHCSIIQKFKEKDKNIDVFYFNVSDIYTEQQVLEYITYLIFNIDNENKRLRNQRLGLNETLLSEDEMRRRTQEILAQP